MKLFSIRPSKRLYYGLAPLGGGGLLLAVLHFVEFESVEAVRHFLQLGWWFSFTVLGVLAMYDGWQCRYSPPVIMRRRIPHNIPVNQGSRVTLHFSHQFSRPTGVELFDGVPDGCETSSFPCELVFQKNKTSTCHYKLKPLQRGDAHFEPAFVRFGSPFRLWQYCFRVGDAEVIKVYPNFSRVHQYSLLSMANHVPLMGIRKQQRRGEGLEFHQLREYRQGDSPRQIDWKATSKKRKLISREYQEERDQQIIFVVDNGRSMRAMDGGESHFDHALDALLLLSYVALKQGDAVGLYLPSADKSRFVSPQKGVASINTLLNAVYDVEPTLQACDFSKMGQGFMRHFPRRSLVVLLTNTRNEDFQVLRESLSLLTKRHLILLANLREQALEDRVHAPVRSLEEALTYAATVDYLSKREFNRKQFEGNNIFYVDETPKGFASKVVNRYLDIKKAGVL